MELQRILIGGLDAAHTADWASRFEAVLSGVEVVPFDPAAPSDVERNGTQVLVLPPEIEGRDVESYLGELRARGVEAPALLVASEQVLARGIDLDQLGIVDALPSEASRFDLDRALAHVRVALRTKERSESLAARLRELEDEHVRQQHTIEQLEGRLAHLDAGDTVSGLTSEMSMVQSVHQAFHLARRHQTPVACLLIGIDDYGNVGEEFGETVAEFVHDQVARRLRDAMRISDTLSRYDQGQFVALTPHTSPSGAEALAHRLRRAVAAQRLERQQHRLTLTLSIGISSFEEEMQSSTQLLEKALAALDEARSSGGDRFCVA